MNRRIELEGKTLNFSARLILPMVDINFKNLPNNFINSYITDNYEVVIVFDKTEEDSRFIHFLDYTKGNGYYRDKSEDEDELSLYYTVLEKDHINIDAFKVGRYSEFTEEFKKKICSYHGIKSNKEDYTAYTHDVIYPLDFKRRQIAERLFKPEDINQGIKLIREVLDKPDLDKEIYKTIQQLQNKQNKQLLDKYDK